MVLGRVLYGPEHAEVHAVPWMGACARRATFAEIVERTEQLAPHARPPPLPDQLAYAVNHAKTRSSPWTTGPGPCWRAPSRSLKMVKHYVVTGSGGGEEQCGPRCFDVTSTGLQSEEMGCHK